MDLQNIADTALSALKDTFKIGSKSIVGIDIGLSSVKIAEMKKISNGRYKLIRYGSAMLPEGAIVEDEIQREDDILMALGVASKKAKISIEAASIGIFGPNTIARKLQLAGGSYEEIEDQVAWESEQYLPFPIEDSTLAFHVFGQNEGGGVDVLVSAARIDVVAAFKGLVESAKFRVKIVDLDLVASTNIFELCLKEEMSANSGSYILLDIGAQKTSLVVYRSSAIAFAKEIMVGGVMITEEIQRQLGVNYREAEDLKISSSSDGNLPEEIVEIVGGILETFFEEVKKTIDFYTTSTSDESFVACRVTGGGALTHGILEGLEETLGISVEFLNPFDSIEIGKIEKSEQGGIAAFGVVAMGLAMREVNE